MYISQNGGAGSDLCRLTGPAPAPSRVTQTRLLRGTYSLAEYLQRQKLHHVSGHPAPLLHHPHGVSWCSDRTSWVSISARCLWFCTEKSLHFFTLSHQTSVHTDKISLSLLEAKQTQLLQPLLKDSIRNEQGTGQEIKIGWQRKEICPYLDFLYWSNIFLLPGSLISCMFLKSKFATVRDLHKKKNEHNKTKKPQQQQKKHPKIFDYVMIQMFEKQ